MFERSFWINMVTRYTQMLNSCLVRVKKLKRSYFLFATIKRRFTAKVIVCPITLCILLQTVNVDIKSEFEELYGTHVSEVAHYITIFDIKKYFESLSSIQRSLLDQVSRVVQLVLVLPATNATSEHSFSALRRVKSYLQSTMSQQKVNNLMLLYVHKEHRFS